MNKRPTETEVAAYEAERRAEMDADAELRRLARIGAWVAQHEARPLQHALDYRAAALGAGVE